MKKIFVSNWITLDGFFAGPNGETDWFSFDEELEQYNLSKLNQSADIIMGRTTFKMMESFWPSEAGMKENPVVVKYMTDSAKHVFSKTVRSSAWENSFFYPEITADLVESIRNKAGKDIVILGSGDVSMQLHRLGLIDQYNIMLDPQLLGKGKPFFQGVDQTSLRLVQTKTFKCGVSYLEYTVKK